MKEIVLPLPSVNRNEALFHAIRQAIITGDFPLAHDFLESFTGLYERDGTLYFQLGGLKTPERRYTATSIVVEIPGIEILTEDASEWWINRDEASKELLMHYIAGAMSQELYAEQMLGP
jgi:hypothetical protein